MAAQQLTRNYSDHSNDTGYQFEFNCDKCGNGYRSSFQTSSLGVAAQVMRGASWLLGDRWSAAGNAAGYVKDALRGPAWDSAFAAAIDEIKPRFRQCTKCGRWVCPEVCWNERAQLCEECAPDLGEHAASIQAQVGVEQMWDKARNADQTKGADLTKEAVAACPHCQGRLAPGAKFCPSCGKPVGAAAKAFCTECGKEMAAGARFCGECGTPAPR